MEKNKQTICISEDYLVKTLELSKRNNQRFCFILGSGASITSGIPMGRTFEKWWMDEIMEDPDVFERNAVRLKAEDMIKNDFVTLKKAWEEAKKWEESDKTEGEPIPSEYYFDIYKLRFFPETRNGYKFLEKHMKGCKPSIGYRALAQLLAEDNGFDFVITTNFDSLAEDALFLYANEHPIVLAHESLADYIDLSTKQPPVIAKVHRGLFFAPMNEWASTDHLSDEWAKVLGMVFASYTPIVIGYAGGDGSLMSYLERDATQINGTMYWCMMKGEQPSDRIQKLVASKGGCFVEISGFDEIMLSIASKLCKDDLDPDTTENMLKRNIEGICTTYAEQWAKCENSSALGDNAALKKAREDEEKREKEGKLSALDYFIRGYRAGEAGNYAEAIDEYTNAIRLNPDYASAYNNRGVVYGNLGEPEKEMADYTKAIELIPNYALAYFNRGNLCYNQGETEKAMADYTKAIELIPDYADAYFNRGVLYDDLGETEKAMADYKKAIELKPDHAYAYNNRGDLYFKRDEREKAMADFSKAIEIDPNYALAYRNRAILYRKMGRLKEAKADEKKADEIEAAKK